MKYLTIYFLLIIIGCLFLTQTNAIFGGGTADKKEAKGSCSLYKGKCGGTIKNTCCKTPYKCAKQTTICGKDKLCCVTEADIQRHKQESGNFLKGRSG